MTAKDELRKMLDERGVRWDYGPSGASSTAFWVNGKELSFCNWRDGLICSTIFTPAQAIAVTLGAPERTCHMRLAYEEEDADGFIWPDHYECNACGASVNGIMPYYDTEIPPKFCPNCGAKVIG